MQSHGKQIKQKDFKLQLSHVALLLPDYKHTHTHTIGRTAQTSTCLGMRGFLQSTSSVFLPWYAQTHTHTHKYTPSHTGALAKPPLARSEQWERLSHDRRSEPAFVGARERGVLLRPLARGPTRDVFVRVFV